MKNVKTTLDDETYARLTALRKKEGLPSISALFLKKCGELTDDREAREIVRMAVKAAARRPTGDRFKLQDLFLEKRWEKFSKGARLRSGRIFKAQVDVARDGIRAVDKSSSNHQFYMKS